MLYIIYYHFIIFYIIYFYIYFLSLYINDEETHAPFCETVERDGLETRLDETLRKDDQRHAAALRT